MSNLMIIGIAGASASGKTLLANTIFSEIANDQVKLIPEDAYYRDHPGLSATERAQLNFDHPDAFEHELMLSHLSLLKQGHSIELPVYDFACHRRSEERVKIDPPRVLIVEGIMLFVEPEIRDQFDIKLFVDTPLDVCLSRRLRRDIQQRGRDIDSVLTQYERFVRPMYIQFIEPSKRHADIIVPQGGENRIAIEVIKAKLHSFFDTKTNAD